jgi:hypothetical protein
MKLYIVHVGYYDQEIGYGMYESHTNFFVVAEDERAAKRKTLSKPVFKERKMHIDGIQEITVVDGYCVQLEKAGIEGDQLCSIGYTQSKAL